MKKMILLFGTICGIFMSIFLMGHGAKAASGVKINKTNFPDELFRIYVQRFDMDDDGYLSVKERNAVHTISLSNSYSSWNFNLKDAPELNLKGITYFTRVQEIKLEYFGIKNLNISGMKKLRKLELIHVRSKILDFSGNPKPEEIRISGNAREIKFAKKSKVKTLGLNTPKMVKKLDFTTLPLLESLSVYRSPVIYMDFSACKKLKKLVWENGNLKRLLLLNSNKALSYLSVRRNRLGALNLRHASNLEYVDCSENPLKRWLWVSGLEKLKELHCYRMFGPWSLNLSGCTGLRTLDCSESSLLQELENLSDCTDLVYLNCSKTEIQELNLYKNTQLGYLKCQHCHIKELDVSRNTRLQNLNCSDNKIEQLDLASCQNLSFIDCCQNPLKSLEVAGLKELDQLDCSQSAIEELNLSGCDSLWSLLCYETGLKKLDLSNNALLSSVECQNCHLTELNVGKNVGFLCCENNQLTELDVSNNPKLFYLKCQDNQLTRLDVSDNPKLSVLYCQNNLLTELDVSKNTELSMLNYSGNFISFVDVSNCSEWIEVIS